MAGHVKTLDHRLLVRRCRCCGYDGALLRGGQAARCARCGCDLRERPARSYAEMEGLLGQPVPVEPPREDPTPRSPGLRRRWMLTIVLAGFGAAAILYLTFAVFAW